MTKADDFPTLGAFVPADTQAGALTIIEDAEGRILLQLRDLKDGIYWPGKWGLVGGGIEGGEDIMTAALREIEEEVGLKLSAADLTPFVKTMSASERRSNLYIFHTQLDLSPSDICLGEGAGFAFWTRAQITKVDILDSLAPVLKKFLSA